MRIGIGHYADVRNYGDYLFPFILKRELSKRIPEAKISCFAASNDPCGPLMSEKFHKDLRFDVAIFAGGEVVHREDAMLCAIYKRFNLDHIEKPTDLIFELPNLGTSYSALIGVGVPVESKNIKEKISGLLPLLSHVSVRGAISAGIMRRSCKNSLVHEIPDLGWLIRTLDDGLHSEDLEEPYIVAQGLEHQCIRIEDLVDALYRISYENRKTIKLMSITDCWGDEDFILKINHAAEGRFQMVWPSPSYEARRRIIERSCGYVGSSLHGSITAMSVGLPAAVVYSHTGNQKFREILLPLGLGGSLVANWSDAPSAFRNAHDHASNIDVVGNLNRKYLQTYFDLLCDDIRKSTS